MEFLFLKKFEIFRHLTSQSECMEQCRYVQNGHDILYTVFRSLPFPKTQNVFKRWESFTKWKRFENNGKRSIFKGKDKMYPGTIRFGPYRLMINRWSFEKIKCSKHNVLSKWELYAFQLSKRTIWYTSYCAIKRFGLRWVIR